MKTNKEFREEAYASLTGKWGMSALSIFIAGAISVAASTIPFIGSIAALFLLPLNYGVAILFLESFRGKPIEIPALFDGFKDYWRIFVTLLLQNVYILLWSLLLIVPGIIKTYSYAMTIFILKDNPELKDNAAIEKSMALMEGHKMSLFLLDLSFIGWGILSALTFGIGFLFLYPYMISARAAFYEDLKKNFVEKVYVTEATIA